MHLHRSLSRIFAYAQNSRLKTFQ